MLLGPFFVGLFLLIVAGIFDLFNRYRIPRLISKGFCCGAAGCGILIAISCVLLLFTFPLGVVGGNQTDAEPQTLSIVAMKDNQSLEGETGHRTGRYYSRGYFEEKLYYTVMYHSTKGLAAYKVSADNCYVIESNDVKPKLEIYWGGPKSKIFTFFYGSNRTIDYCKLYVPVGTVDGSFEIDLE
jgi:hypothetical protein